MRGPPTANRSDWGRPPEALAAHLSRRVRQLAAGLVAAANQDQELELEQEYRLAGAAAAATSPQHTATSMTPQQTTSSATSSSRQPEQSFSDWWNEYWSRQPFPSGYTQSSITLLACLLTTIMFLIVVGNLLVCIAIFTEKSLKPTQNWFIASLAVSDMLLGLVVMPFSLARELMGFWVFGPLWCDVHEAIDVLLTTASINTLCLISLDRYWSITQAVSYLKKRTPRRGAAMIAFVWIFSAAVSLPPLFGWKKQSPSIHAAANSTAELRGRRAWDELPAPAPDWPAPRARPAPAAGPPSPSPAAASGWPDGAAVEYPSCQLSDDVGYVLYSALGSFYIPCAVMIFTYIKIFLAARSRARRAINKQSARTGAGQHALPAAKTRAQTGPAASGARPRPSMSPTGAPEPQQPGPEPEPEPMMKGKIVIVERKKSMAAVAPPPALATCALERAQMCCMLTTGAAHQASASALSADCDPQPAAADKDLPVRTSADHDVSRDSSMITVMSSNMADLPPVTRFNFRPPVQPEVAPEVASSHQERLDPSRALLKAIGRAESELEADRLLADHQAEPGQAEPVDEAAPANATKETCFMTIEEDSDVFDAQTGRTIMMIAGNASHRQASATSNKAITMTIPATSGQHQQHQHQQHQIQHQIQQQQHSQQQVPLCQNAICRARQMQARTGSSYCGSSMTINDDDLDDEELLTDDCNGYSQSCTLDQFCTSAAGSVCAHCQECDQLQAASRSCSSAPAHKFAEADDSPGAARMQPGSHRCSHDRHQVDLQAEPLSSTGDDNLSLNEYRSNEDSSSLVGHDVLDATTTDERHRDRRDRDSRRSKKKPARNQDPSSHKSGASADRKKSIIGFRLARLASSATPLGHQSGGLLELAANSQQQNANQHHLLNQMHNPPASGTRNLKALRQNFFLKLNQLTAKSTFKDVAQQASARRGSQSNGKSSSGTSFEPSLDCATTTNVHSADYQPELSAVSPEAYSATTRLARAEHEAASESHHQQQQQQQVNQADRSSPRNSKSADLRRPLGAHTSISVITSSGGGSSGVGKFPRFEDEPTLDKQSSRADAQLARPSSQQLQLQVHHQQPRPAKKTNSAPNQINRSSTLVSSSGGGSQGTSRAYLASDNERHKRKLAKARERRATLILGLIMAAFVCSWMPFFTFYVLRAVCTVCRDYIPPRFEAFIFWMGYCNSAINPIIYTIFNRDFRRAFRKILFKCL